MKENKVKKIVLGSTPQLRKSVTTRSSTFLVGDPYYKPSLATVTGCWVDPTYSNGEQYNCGKLKITSSEIQVISFHSTPSPFKDNIPENSHFEPQSHEGLVFHDFSFSKGCCSGSMLIFEDFAGLQGLQTLNICHGKTNPLPPPTSLEETWPQW